MKLYLHFSILNLSKRLLTFQYYQIHILLANFNICAPVTLKDLILKYLKDIIRLVFVLRLINRFGVVSVLAKNFIVFKDEGQDLGTFEEWVFYVDVSSEKFFEFIMVRVGKFGSDFYFHDKFLTFFCLDYLPTCLFNPLIKQRRQTLQFSLINNRPHNQWICNKHFKHRFL